MTTNTKANIVIKVERTPCFNFAFQQNGIPVISRLEIINQGDSTWEGLRVEMKLLPDLAPVIELEVQSLPSGGTVHIDDVDFILEFDRLSTWSERLRGDIQIHIEGKALGSDELLTVALISEPIDIYAWNEWTGLQTLPEIICSFITPNLVINDTVLGDASRLLEKRTGDGSLEGYQSESKERVYAIIGAIYDAVAHREIRYAVPPASFESTGQRVRFGNGILESGFGTCLDLSLWFASLFEQAGLRPLILMHEGHAYVGCWLKEESFPEPAIDDLQRIRKRVEFQDILVLETTACTQGKGINLDGAVREASAHLKKDGIFCMGVDVNRCRANGIRPLPLQASGGKIDAAVKNDNHSGTPRPESGTRDFAPDLEVTENETSETRLDRWKQHLLDLTLRNRLLNFRESKQTVPFACIDPGKLEDNLATSNVLRIEPESGVMKEQDPRDVRRLARSGGESPLEQYLIKELEDKRLRAVLPENEMNRRLLELYRSSRLELQESGANTLFLALGMLEWTQTDASDKKYLAPIILLPVRLDRKSVISGYTLIREDADPVVNVTLLELLRRDFSLQIPGLDPLPEDEKGIDVDLILKRFTQAILDNHGWEVHMEVWLGRFSFNKFLLWKDLQDRLEYMTKNAVVNHLVHKPGEPFNDGIETSVAESMDDVTNLNEIYIPLSSDSSQLAAIVASAKGKNYVLYGPPGTGKSQTIANIITHNIAIGRTVLFVAEKRAALEVVHSRLSKLGLSEFCLELHSNKTGKADVVRQFGDVMDMVSFHNPEEWEYKARQLQTIRDELNQRVRELHRPGPAGITPYQCYAYLIYHSETSKRLGSIPRLSFSDLEDHTLENLDKMRQNLKEMVLQLRRVEESDRQKLHPFRFLNWTPNWEQEACEKSEKLISSTREFEEQYKNLGETLGVSPLPSDSKAIPRTIKFAILLTQGKSVPRSFICSGGWDDFLMTVRSEWIPALKIYAESYKNLKCFDLAAVEKIDVSAIHEKYKKLNSEGPFLYKLRCNWLIRSVRKCLKNPKEKVSDNWEKVFFSPYAKMLKNQSILDCIDKDAKEMFGRYWRGVETDATVLEDIIMFGQKVHQEISNLAGADPNRLVQFKSEIAGFLEQFDDLLSEGKPVYQIVAQTVRKWNLYTKAQQEFNKHLNVDLEASVPGSDYFERMMVLGRACLESRASLRYWGAWQRGRSVGIKQGLGPFVEDLEIGKIALEDSEICFEMAYRTSVLNQILNSSEVLRNFFGDEQEQHIQKFRQLDEEYLNLTAKAARARLVSNLPLGRHKDAIPDSEMGLLQRERVRKRRHKPVRKLLSEIPSLLPKLKPCLLMSPLSVAQYLDAEQSNFDVVVFDEASQIPVWDAVGVIARGKQLIVAGDPKQLPPTNFFGRSDADESLEDLDVIEDQESILDECMGAGLPCCHLNWHYRSQNESLIAFSNHHYYENRLFTFPSSDNISTGVSWVHVPDGHYDKGRTRTNRAEGERVVEEIQKRLHDPERNHESIGVVTFSQAQQVLIENLLDELRMRDPFIESYFDEGTVEDPIFVKNLENVQGDERDVIIFSIGYGPDATGKLSMNFGPLNLDVGERRLNVAVTRAKREVVLISTLRAEQIDLARTRSKGVAQLKAYMEYAQRGPRALGDQENQVSIDSFDSEFEKEVCRFLEKQGHKIHTQVGCSGYRIDLAIIDPQESGRYLVGIECDGASYHSAATARDRDRLRHLVLEGLGWRIVRVWSTDWWNNRKTAEQHFVEAIQDAIEQRKTELTKSKEISSIKPVTDNVQERVMDEKDDKKNIPLSLPLKDVYYPTPDPEIQHDQENFYLEKSKARLQKQITRIIDREGPICESLLLRRVAEEWQFGRTGAKIREQILGVINAVSTTETGGHKIYWPSSINPKTYDEYRVPNPDNEKTYRSLDIIPCPEIRSAMVALVRDYGSVPIDSLLKETLKVFGGKQLSAQSRELLESSLRANNNKLRIENDHVIEVKEVV